MVGMIVKRLLQKVGSPIISL